MRATTGAKKTDGIARAGDRAGGASAGRWKECDSMARLDDLVVFLVPRVRVVRRD